MAEGLPERLLTRRTRTTTMAFGLVVASLQSQGLLRWVGIGHRAF